MDRGRLSLDIPAAHWSEERGKVESAGVELEAYLFPREIDLMRDTMKRSRCYLEFGTGGSCKVAAESGVKRIVSVDTDSSWSERVRNFVGRNFPGISADFVHIDLGEVEAWGYPVDRTPKPTWPSYFIRPWDILKSKGEKPDLIYIDGRFRVACTLYSILMLSLQSSWLSRPRATFMIHDFSSRDYYHKVLDYLRVVRAENTLYVMEMLPKIDERALLADLLVYQADLR
ncbi:MAG: hypothetical protein NVV83_21225 [Afipia sp.]|nr:hypothetical protein [Afipia sp.]